MSLDFPTANTSPCVVNQSPLRRPFVLFPKGMVEHLDFNPKPGSTPGFSDGAPDPGPRRTRLSCPRASDAAIRSEFEVRVFERYGAHQSAPVDTRTSSFHIQVSAFPLTPAKSVAPSVFHPGPVPSMNALVYWRLGLRVVGNRWHCRHAKD